VYFGSRCPQGAAVAVLRSLVWVMVLCLSILPLHHPLKGSTAAHASLVPSSCSMNPSPVATYTGLKGKPVLSSERRPPAS
jgi:hypothetical protein